MLLSKYGPHCFSTVVTDPDSRMSFDLRGRLLYADIEGAVQHIVEEGDTWWTLADRYYTTSSDVSGARLWWVLPEFQPTPINDPTLALVVGSTVIIPPLNAVMAALAEGLDDSRMEGE